MVISVKELNLSPLYTAVDHSPGNDNAAFGGDSTVVRDFCPYPLPLFYRLSSVVHKVSHCDIQPYCAQLDSAFCPPWNGKMSIVGFQAERYYQLM